MVKVSVIITTLGQGGTTSRANEWRVSENNTNDNRAVQVWGEGWGLGKHSNSRKSVLSRFHTLF